MEQNGHSTEPAYAVSEVQEQIKKAIMSNAIVFGLLKSTGYYDKIIENVPEIIIILLETDRGVNVLKRLGLYDAVQKLSG